MSRRVSRAVFAIVAGLAPVITAAANIVVTTSTPAEIHVTASTPPEVHDDQRCSLIEAIDNANNDDGAHPDCAAGNGADIIVLPASSNQTITAVYNSICGYTGLPLITSTITFEGNGSTITRESDSSLFRIFAVAKGAELHLQTTNTRGGASQIFGSPFEGGGVGYGRPWSGGGVLNYGTLEENNSKFSNNTS